jgi:hypothetical protein
MTDEPAPASISAAAKLWVVNSGEFERESGSWGVFWEPLAVRLGPDAKPSTCYGRFVAFYDRTGNGLLADMVQHYDFKASLFPHLLLIEGRWWEVVGGRCEHRKGQWAMRWSVSTATRWARKLNGETEDA